MLSDENSLWLVTEVARLVSEARERELLPPWSGDVSGLVDLCVLVEHIWIDLSDIQV